MAVKDPILPRLSGFTEIEFGGEHAYARNSDGHLFYPSMIPMWPELPKKWREDAYTQEKIITFEDNLLTVDEAEKLFWQYFPDTSREDTANELKRLISEAKDHIRDLYPDIDN